MEAISLPHNNKALLYVHPAYKEQCKTKISIHVDSRVSPLTPAQIKASLSKADFNRCCDNSIVLLDLLAHSGKDVNDYMYEFFNNVSADPQLLAWYINIAIMADIDRDIVLRQASAVYTNSYMLKFWDTVSLKAALN